MYLDLIKGKLLSFPEFNEFIDMKHLLTRATDRDGVSWDYVFCACEAAGGNALQAVPAAAANFCMLTSIHLVDDMLDNDPAGDYHRYGIGTCANMALTYQALGIRMIELSELNPPHKLAIIDNLSQMMCDTSVAQQKDVFGKNITENDYWDKISSKTPPLFSSALFSGALSGGARLTTARQTAKLGLPIGKMIQISDDLSDIYKEAVEPDWGAPRNNLALLYCLDAEYDLKNEFLSLLPQIKEEGILKKAQEIVTRSGALSYCIYHIMALHKELMEQISLLELPTAKKLEMLAGTLIEPSVELIKLTGINNPGQFLKMELKTFE
jgi:geranylgeranyl pyrophosphate synthase